MKKILSDRSKAFLRLFAIASVLVGASFPSVGQTSAPVYIAFDGAYGVKTNTAPKAIELGIEVIDEAELLRRVAQQMGQTA
jgi:hypothetical protein